MRALVFTDIHQHGDIVNDRLVQEKATLLLSCGDQEGYYQPPVMCYFVPGNHEDMALIGTMKQVPDFTVHPNLNIILPGQVKEVAIGEDFLQIAGMGGIYDPAKLRGGDPRYFTNRDVRDLMAAKGARLDVCLFHETIPSLGIKRKGKVMGSQQIERCINSLRPVLSFHGHHDATLEGRVGDTRVVQLPTPKLAYCVLEADKYGVVSYQIKKSPNEPLTGVVNLGGQLSGAGK